MRKLLLGIVLLAASFTSELLPIHTTAAIVVYTSLFCLGLYYLYDGIIFLYTGKSFIRTFPRKVVHHLLLACAIAGIITEFLGNWLYKFWVYPHFPVGFYLLVIVVAKCFYFFLLFENYLALQVLFRKLFPSRKSIHIQRKRVLTVFFSVLGFIGVAGFVYVNFAKMLLYRLPKNFLDIFNTYWVNGNTIAELFLLCISLWFVFEYLEYQRREDTLLLHVLHGDFTALFALLGASLITSLIMEVFNLPLSVWVYTNVPYQHIVFAGIPIVIFILWPFQYLLFDCFYHFVYKKETESMWE